MLPTGFEFVLGFGFTFRGRKGRLINQSISPYRHKKNLSPFPERDILYRTPVQVRMRLLKQLLTGRQLSSAVSLFGFYL
jgi:hypothetical protein